MYLTDPEANGISLSFVEGALTLIAVGIAAAFPGTGDAIYRAIEGAIARISLRQVQSLFIVGMLLVVIRLLILPLLPVPLPFTPDDFSFQLGADTFMHGRLANPTPAMWIHFESIHIDLRPTYVSMYFPGQSLAMALGKLLFGNSWIGLLLVSAAMCGGICWMLQAWFPSRWALAGGLIAVIHLGLFTYWTNTYSGGALVAALGGALLLGAAGRWKRNPSIGNHLILATGAGLLAITRPYEGVLLCLPVGWFLFRYVRKKTINAGTLVRNALPGAVLLICILAWLGLYNYRAFGSPFTLPYTINRSTYAVAPYYVWQKERPAPEYHHEEIKRFYLGHELDQYKKIHSWSGFLPQTLIKLIQGVLFFAGIAFLPLLFAAPHALRDKRMRFLVLCLAVLIAGLSIEVYFIPHYVAPFTAAIYALGIQCMRHLCQWRPARSKIGLAIVRLSMTVCILVACRRPFNECLGMPISPYPQSNWTSSWYGPDHFGAERKRIQNQLKKMPGNQLVFVQYSPEHEPSDEWVYNSADIEHSRVIWARSMGTTEDRKLLDYYRTRTAWIVYPDRDPVALEPYR